MISKDLYSLYQQEREAYIDLLMDGEFPSFATWREEYTKDFSSNHNNEESSTVDMDSELSEDIDSEDENLLTTLKEENKMAENVKKPNVEKTETTAVSNPSKASIAKKIMTDNWTAVQEGTMARKDVITLFTSKAGLTDKGAATYYQQYRAKLLNGETLIKS